MVSACRAVVAAVCAVGVLVVPACAGFEDTITAEQAAERVEVHVRALAAALPGARLEVQSQPHIDPCNAPLDNGPLGRVFAGVAYWVRDIPPERNAEMFDLAVQYWEAQGWAVNDDLRPQRAFVGADAPEPDFTGVALIETADGSQILSIAASSPCVWPNGTPEPC